MFKAINIEATFHLAHAIKQQLNNQLDIQNLGISPMHVRVLKIIGEIPGSTAMDIAALFKRDKAQITRLVNHLIDQELITKKPNPNDKRSQFLELTATGAVLQGKLKALSDKMESRMIEGIKEEDLEIFSQVAQQMKNNLIDRF
ncbi:MarR family winged helix-turn-helix transcriptional regulator [Marinomonas sp. 2405UD66-6]|uniref:MarR family winged helix-turn-helix transcriptional regulator n=1 Tax=Marinomonas sp. 2405UD66-6 TaxID=3391834 RepID=UPI0039C9D5C1